MSESVLTVDDAARELPALVDRVRSHGDSAVLLDSGKPVARIVPMAIPADGTAKLIACLRRWRAQYPDPDDGFGEAIEESRRSISPPHDPWQ